MPYPARSASVVYPVSRANWRKSSTVTGWRSIQYGARAALIGGDSSVNHSLGKDWPCLSSQSRTHGGEPCRNGPPGTRTMVRTDEVLLADLNGGITHRGARRRVGSSVSLVSPDTHSRE